jgi:hypothetical protein
MQPLETTTAYAWFKKKFNKKIPFFTFVDYKFHQQFVLDTISKNTLTVLDCSQDPIPVLDIKIELINVGLDDKVIFLTSNFDDYSASRNIFYFPYQFFRSKANYKSTNIYVKRKYKVSCLNRNPNTHKIYTFFKLYQFGYFDEMLISFNNVIPTGSRPLLTMQDHVINCMPDEIKKEIAKINLFRNDLADDMWDWSKLINTVNHPAFNNAYLNIITETSYTLRCLSEKTFKPIVAGQLFTFSSAPGSLSAIHNLGFEIFNDIIDSSYDSIINMYDRIDSMINIVDSIYDNIESMYESNRERILYNQQYFWSDELENKFIRPLDHLGIFK